MSHATEEQIRLMPWVTEFRCWWLKRRPQPGDNADLAVTRPDGYIHQCFWFAVANGNEYAEQLNLGDYTPGMAGVPPLDAPDLRLLMLKRGFECMQQANPALKKDNVTRLRPV